MLQIDLSLLNLTQLAKLAIFCSETLPQKALFDSYPLTSILKEMVNNAGLEASKLEFKKFGLTDNSYLVYHLSD